MVGEDLEDAMKFRTGEPGNTHMVFDKVGSKPFLRMSVSLTEDEYHQVVNAGQLDVTIEPVQTREERLREARLRAFEARNQGMLRALTALEAVEVIERVDAEFAKENGE